MMSSAIAARLVYQCGHAALVTLPRIKGESTAQRNERVTREKKTAQLRVCDFCTPAVVAEQPVLETLVAAAPIAAVALPVEASLVVAAPEPAPTTAVALNAAVEAAIASASQQLEDEPAATPQPTAAQATPTTPVAGTARRARPARSPRTQPSGGSRTRAPHGARRTSRPRQVAVASEPGGSTSPAGLSRLLRSAPRSFTVRFIVQQSIVADSLAEAIRQFQAQGATEIVAISKVR
jgi:hypothetical protein